jgi:hypothetical protein
MAPPEIDPPPKTAATVADETSWPAETTSSLGPTWKRHDRTHLEISLQYPVPVNGPAVARIWESFYFLPESFRLDSTTYSKRELFADSRSYVRFTAPWIELELVPKEARELAQRLTSKAPDTVVWELKLFASRVRAAIVEESQATTADMATADEIRITSLAATFLAIGNGALSAMREVLGPQKLRTLSFEPVDPEVAKTQAWVDEYLSRVLELAFIHLANVVEKRDGPKDVAEAAIAAAVDEARYRQSRSEGPVSSSDGSVHDLEEIERRQHALKRFTSSVLWLDVQTREGYTVALHIFHALAAGIAMAFAVIIAVLFGQPNVPGKLGMWAAVVVVAYMGKDRLKAILQNVFDSVVATRLPDRRWSVSMPGETSVLADVEERVGFIDRDDIPDSVDTTRSVAYRDRLQELAGPESILYHRKIVRARTETMRALAPEFAELTDVMRVDVSRWLTHTDDAKRTVTFADPEAGELFQSKLPRAYDVIVVYRLSDAKRQDTEWQVARIVVSRNGIRRVVLLQKERP